MTLLAPEREMSSPSWDYSADPDDHIVVSYGNRVTRSYVKVDIFDDFPAKIVGLGCLGFEALPFYPPKRYTSCRRH